MSYNESAAKLCAAILSSVEPSDRHNVVTRAIAGARGRTSPPAYTVRLVPAELDQDLVNDLVRGWGADLSALAIAAANESAGTIRAQADAMTSSGPMIGDPLSHGASGTSWARAVALAAATMPDMASHEPWLRQLADELERSQREHRLQGDPGKWLTTKFLPSLAKASDVASQLLTNAGADTTASTPQTVEVIQSVTDSQLPNSQLTTIAAMPQVSNLVEQLGANPTNDQLAELKTIIDRLASRLPEVPTVPDGTQSSADEARSTLETTRVALSAQLQEANAAKDEADKLGIEAARIQWALAMLDTPDPVAQMLKSVNPSMSTPDNLLSTVVGILAGAKDTGALTAKGAMNLSKKLLFGSPERFGDDEDPEAQPLDDL